MAGRCDKKWVLNSFTPCGNEMQEQEHDSHLLLVAVEVGLLAVLGGGVELRAQVLELLHTIIMKQKSSRIPGEAEQRTA